MTPRERWLAAVRMKPVDRLPFWPKIGAAYLRAQVAPFRDMTTEQLHGWIGSDRHDWLPGCLRETRKRTSIKETSSDGVMHTVYITPIGDLEMVMKFDAGSDSWHPVRFPVSSLDDIRKMMAVYEDVAVDLNPAALRKAEEKAKAIGEDAVTAVSIGTSPLMEWVQHLAGTEQGHFLLADYPEEVSGLFNAMHRVMLDRVNLMAVDHPADLLYVVENTSTTLISPDQYRAYCIGHITEYGAIARQTGRNLVLHMCGHLKALLPDLAAIPAHAFEAFTSPTVGNTSLLDGRTQCPDKCLIGGTNAVLWTQPAGAIIRQIEKDLDVLSHHRGIVVTSAGVMPPACRPETIREVAEWVRRYAVRS